MQKDLTGLKTWTSNTRIIPITIFRWLIKGDQDVINWLDNKILQTQLKRGTISLLKRVKVIYTSNKSCKGQLHTLDAYWVYTISVMGLLSLTNVQLQAKLLDSSRGVILEHNTSIRLLNLSIQQLSGYYRTIGDVLRMLIPKAKCDRKDTAANCQPVYQIA